MRKFIKPAREGLIVRDHTNKFRPLPDTGAEVGWDVTWERRLRDGDVLVIDPSKPKSAAASGATARAKAQKPTKSED